jgi:thiamine-phosphate pyrophosphorylase
LSPRPKPVLCCVTDRRGLSAADEVVAARAIQDQVARVAAAGVDWIQVREKDLATRQLLQLVSAAVKVVSVFSTRIIVNDRLDVALAAGAAGVHLGGESLPVAEVSLWKKAGRVSAEFLVGASCHSLEAASAAERDGADYLFLGPVFATPSKVQYGLPLGLERLRETCAAIRIPVLAIGGINIENAASCIQAGAAGIAAIRLFQGGEAADSIVKRLKG